MIHFLVFQYKVLFIENIRTNPASHLGSFSILRTSREFDRLLDMTSS
jgi:hypothetical protein